MKLTLGAKKFAPAFTPFSTDYPGSTTVNTNTTTTVAVPAGATMCQIECYSSGGGYRVGKASASGNGGTYAKKNSHSISALGYTSLYISVYGPCGLNAFATGHAFVRQNNSSGSILAYAQGGAAGSAIPSTSSSTGDVLNAGGKGVGGNPNAGGGGCGGTSGAGSSAVGSTGGAAGGGAAGAGGTYVNTSTPGAGQQYGGGAAANGQAPLQSGRGLVRISWS